MGNIFCPGITMPNREIGHRSFDFSRQVPVMAAVEVKRGSIRDRGAGVYHARAIEACHRAIDAGADWIDIRVVPRTPGPRLTAKEELSHLVPVVQSCRRHSDAVISVSTAHAHAAGRLLLAGADALRDTSGPRDPGLARIAAETGAGLIITHPSAGQPGPEQPAPDRLGHGDLTRGTAAFLRERAESAIRLGVGANQIIVDSGYDLARFTYPPLGLTGLLGNVTSTGYPVLVSCSNTGPPGGEPRQPSERRAAAAVAGITVCILHGARLVRVHDVRAVIAAVHITEAILGWREPLAPRHNLGLCETGSP